MDGFIKYSVVVRYELQFSNLSVENFGRIVTRCASQPADGKGDLQRFKFTFNTDIDHRNGDKAITGSCRANHVFPLVLH